MADRLLALRLFARAGRLGNFSAAAREFGLSQPSASRLIATLEREIGATLFNRTTRIVRLTETGTAYLARVETILLALDEADHEARGTGELRGTLRVGLPSSLLLQEVVPRLAQFKAQHPALRLELVCDGHRDLVTDSLDVAIRFGPLRDSSSVARKMLATPWILAASPAYIAEHGEPLTPADLPRHTVVLGPPHGSPDFSFCRDGQVISVSVESRLRIALAEGAIAAAEAGMGILSSSLLSCRPGLQRETLVQVLSDWDLGLLEIHALHANRNSVKPAARIFTSFLADELRLSKQSAEPLHKLMLDAND